MKKLHIKALFGAVGTSVLLMASPAQAAFNWSYTNSASVYCNTCSRDSTFSGQTITGTATAWSTKTTSVDSPLYNQTLVTWGSYGLGVYEGTVGPQHAVDSDGEKESVLFSFTESIALTQITMGWIYNDADFSLFRYIGNSADTEKNLSDKKYTELVSSGSWDLVGNSEYSNGKYVDGSEYTANVNSGNLTSSLWLVAALNASTSSGSCGCCSCSDGADYFKLKSLAGFTPSTPPPGGVPEPSTLALMSLSFVAFGFTRNRRRKNLSA